MEGQVEGIMKPRKKQKKLRITEADFMLANRRAARLEEIEQHGKPVSFRKVLQKSKKAYNRKRLKKEIQLDCFSHQPGTDSVTGLTII